MFLVDGDSSAISAKFMEGQTVQLEDGSTAFIQAAATPKTSQNIQVQLEDGTTAFINPSLFESPIANSLIVTQQEAGGDAGLAAITQSLVSAEREQLLSLGRRGGISGHYSKAW